MPKKVPLLRDDTEGSVYAAWSPMFGQFDVRQMELFTSKEQRPTYDLDLDVYAQGDAYEKAFICASVFV